MNTRILNNIGARISQEPKLAQLKNYKQVWESKSHSNNLLINDICNVQETFGYAHDSEFQELMGSLFNSAIDGLNKLCLSDTMHELKCLFQERGWDEYLEFLLYLDSSIDANFEQYEVDELIWHESIEENRLWNCFFVNEELGREDAMDSIISDIEQVERKIDNLYFELYSKDWYRKMSADERKNFITNLKNQELYKY